MPHQILQEIRSDIDELLKLNVTFHKNFTYGESSWTHWGEYQEWINYNILSLKSVVNLAEAKCYRDSFVLVRTVFESFFLIELTMLAKYLYFNYLPYRGETKYQLLTRAKLEAPKVFGKKNIKNIKLVENMGRPFKVQVVYRANPVSRSNKVIPRHYFIFKEYNPDELYLSGISLGDIWGKRLKKRGKKKIQSRLSNTFLNMPVAILNFLKINRLATARERDAIVVHYNFLSKFTHGVSESYSILSKNKQRSFLRSLDEVMEFDYFKELLCLLYACHLAIYYIELQMKFFLNEEEIKIKNLESIKKIVLHLKDKYSFFWFVYNKPTDYDIFQYKIRQIIKKKPNLSPKDSQIKCHKNPLSRLEDLHIDYCNQSIGRYMPPKILI